MLRLPANPIRFACAGAARRALTSPLLKPLTAKFTQVAHTDQELPTILLDERPARS